MRKFFLAAAYATAFMAGWGYSQNNWVFVFIEAVISLCCILLATFSEK